MRSDDEAPDLWWREALCAEIGGDLFSCIPGEQGQTAIRACQMCPVRQKCLADELTQRRQAEGIYGGFNQTDRRRMRNRVARGQDPMLVAYAAIRRERS